MAKKNAIRQTTADVKISAEFLLVQFNNIIREVRRCADNCLTKLMDTFPYLLWDGQVIGTALTLVQCMSKVIEEDKGCKLGVLESPKLKWKLNLEDTLPQRESIARDFSSRVQQILCEAMKWAPGTTHGHLLEYVRKNSSNSRSLRLIIDAVLHHQIAGADLSPLTSDVSSVVGGPVTREKAPVDVSIYLTALSQRANYLGQVQGMLHMLQISHGDEETAHEHLAEHLDNKFQLIVTNKDEKPLEVAEQELKEVIMLSAAFLVISNKPTPKLLYNIVWIPEQNFTEEVMQLCIQCWNWVLVAREDIQIHFLQEMSGCFLRIAQKQQGLFSRNDDQVECPLSVSECSRRISPLVKPHSVWASVSLLRSVLLMIIVLVSG